MSAAMAEACPVPGCGAPLEPGTTMCRQHWKRVPEDLRLWLLMSRSDPAQHIDALKAAVTAARLSP